MTGARESVVRAAGIVVLMVALSGPAWANDSTDSAPADQATEVSSAGSPQAVRQAKPVLRAATTPMPRARPKVLRKRFVQAPRPRLPAPPVQQTEGWRLFPWLSPSAPQRHVARLPMIMGVGF
jgi:hypothetical protein